MKRLIAFVIAVCVIELGVLAWGLKGPVNAQSSPSGEAWTCSVDNIGATLTLCKASKNNYRLYITDVLVQSTTATGAGFLLRYGTGSACGTGTVSLLPSGAAVPRIGYPAATSAPTKLSFVTPISAPKDTDLCIICTVTNTCTAQLSGYAAP